MKATSENGQDLVHIRLKRIMISGISYRMI